MMDVLFFLITGVVGAALLLLLFFLGFVALSVIMAFIPTILALAGGFMLLVSGHVSWAISLVAVCLLIQGVWWFFMKNWLDGRSVSDQTASAQVHDNNDVNVKQHRRDAVKQHRRDVVKQNKRDVV